MESLLKGDLRNNFQSPRPNVEVMYRLITVCPVQVVYKQPFTIPMEILSVYEGLIYI